MMMMIQIVKDDADDDVQDLTLMQYMSMHKET